MKIAILASLLGTEATGQSAAVSTLSERLLGAGHEVTVLATDCIAGGGTASVKNFVPLAKGVRLLMFRSEGRLNRRLFRSPELVSWLKNHVAEFDVLDVQGTWSFVGRDAAAIFAKASKPYVLTPHGMMTRFDWNKNILRRKLLFVLGFGNMWRKADAIRFLSSGEQESSYCPPQGLTSIIPNCIDLTPIYSVSEKPVFKRRLGLSNSASLLLFLGRITEQKGVKEMLSAFELAAQSMPDLLFYLVGPAEGSYGREVLAQIESSQFKHRIRFVGPIFGEEKSNYLRAADAFITLSYNEGQSIAHLEAMAEAIPLILTASSNMDRLEEYGAGVLTTHVAPDAAAAIAQVLSNRETRESMGRNARRLVEENYTPDVVVPLLTGLYRRVVENKNGSA